ncbi:cupin domain-containing protein [Catalinimonas niigatensis]|uniref:cupin domain-containing protein n=1 Tax=Catalinimonas niigatensis TaxID=1397264 RepID=UPI002665479E|nr:cupin domain-containing protein [Catalinimonas niigatensis]WPP47994.1 cupin domain-containing protein [Catalinimonas niigatensis]
MKREVQNSNQESSDQPNSPLLTYNFPSLIQQMKQEGSWEKSGRSAKTLYKADAMRIVLNTMKAGTEIKTHQANGPISVQVIEGQLKFSTEKESQVLNKGEMLTLQPHIRHSVEAIEETAFLLTIGTSGNLS